jgi:hypothetical protein
MYVSKAQESIYTQYGVTVEYISRSIIKHPVSLINFSPYQLKLYLYCRVRLNNPGHHSNNCCDVSTRLMFTS